MHETLKPIEGPLNDVFEAEALRATTRAALDAADELAAEFRTLTFLVGFGADVHGFPCVSMTVFTDHKAEMTSLPIGNPPSLLKAHARRVAEKLLGGG